MKTTTINVARNLLSPPSLLLGRLLCLIMAAMILFWAAPAQASSPYPLVVSWDNPNPAQNGLVKVNGNGNAWSFSLILEGVYISSGPTWVYPGSTADEPEWGSWLETPTTLVWSGSNAVGTFAVSIKGKIKRIKAPGGGGGGGEEEEKDFEASWSGEARGAKNWEPGTGISGGEITAPMPVAPATTTLVDPKATMGCSVSPATDSDKWTRGEEVGFETEGITYNWKSSGGRFTGSTSGPTAQWIAPEKAGVYSITCVVDDVDTEVESPDTGERGDDFKSTTVSVTVPPKDWSAGSAIGDEEERDAAGTVINTIKSGRIVAPQDQRDLDETKWKPKKVQARISGLVNCTVETAVDRDKWTQGSLKGEESDTVPTVNYVWTGGDGVDTGFFVSWKTLPNGQPDLDAHGQPKANLTTSVTGLSATFKVSATADVTSVVTCTIKDLPKGVALPETGTRDDTTDLVRNVSILSYDPSSYAELKLFRTDATKTDSLGAQILGGSAGGKVKVVLEVQVGGKSKVADASKSVRLRLEENDSRHVEGSNVVRVDGVITKAAVQGQNHINIDISLAGTWQKWTGTDWTASGSPGEENDTGAPKKYRKIIDWNTGEESNYADPDGEGPLVGSKLMGHNGPHTASIYKATAEEAQTIEFCEKDGDGVYGDPAGEGPLPCGVDVQNAVVQNVRAGDGNTNYIRFDPESSNAALKNPTISFDIKDDGDPHKYVWYIWLRDTRNGNWQLFATFRGEMDGPGSKTVTINAPTGGDTQTEVGTGDYKALTEWGTYAFDVTVKEWDGTTEYDWLPSIRSSLISIPASMPANAAGVARPGHEITPPYSDDEQTIADWRISYLLQSDRNASAMRVDLLDPDLAEQATYSGPTAAGTPVLDHAISTAQSSDLSGTYIGVFTPTDAFGDQYRDHMNRAMRSLNQRPSHIVFHVFVSVTNDTAGNLTPSAPVPGVALREATFGVPVWARANFRSVAATSVELGFDRAAVTGTSIVRQKRQRTASYMPAESALSGLAEFSYAWNVTKDAGRWKIGVIKGFKSNGDFIYYPTKDKPVGYRVFKINKRAQIVEMARFYAGQGLTRAAVDGLACDGFTGHVYDVVGLQPDPAANKADLGHLAGYPSDPYSGALLGLYYSSDANASVTSTPGHTAIRDGIHRVEINGPTIAAKSGSDLYRPLLDAFRSQTGYSWMWSSPALSVSVPDSVATKTSFLIVLDGE